MSKVKPLRKLGGLEVLEIPGSPQGGYVVVFHGFGANAQDLLPLGHLLNPPPGTGWLFTEAPLKVSDGGIPGKAWFPLNVEALDRAVSQGVHYDLSGSTPEGLKKARQLAVETIAALNVPLSRIVLMGFSQGAMLATDLALRFPEKVAGLVILSGTLLNETLWKEKALTKAGLPFFQSHGDSDPLLSLAMAQRLEKVLVEAGLKGQLHAFRGGHEVPQEVIHRLSQFLQKVLTPQN